ncbi:hypothetical protein [Nocardioides solisilvae]|uniref:hypothetical protein n=1 Tax=Nocardioides solisilvae TaxID=1542435 RepID=UPI000D750DAD|nr:hypothetical protein [Nocardioides solisilvae]
MRFFSRRRTETAAVTAARVEEAAGPTSGEKELVAVFTHLHEVLLDEIAQRPARQGTGAGHDFMGRDICAPLWRIHECRAMAGEVLRLRAERGGGRITPGDVESIEKDVREHPDFARQFALGCARLVLADS